MLFEESESDNSDNLLSSDKEEAVFQGIDASIRPHVRPAPCLCETQRRKELSLRGMCRRHLLQTSPAPDFTYTSITAEGRDKEENCTAPTKRRFSPRHTRGPQLDAMKSYSHSDFQDTVQKLCDSTNKQGQKQEFFGTCTSVTKMKKVRGRGITPDNNALCKLHLNGLTVSCKAMYHPNQHIQ
ncbi:piggyBac transposable element-derived protein 4-like isoform X1 [Acipenser oxyrinchus oxyrinchus]|uniref:PiggyBac transposable element-derived protein 4-like isoform X1 n=1 Tax=Acipenser oxyrinchus oxyrinchus TaxID=40147 RepID=A0AAD8D5M3_ACIOX|nr:piggyBac transposable element-derived protein 4-like isoform X1 [Acipenser oxyrinchus oxyrinchus]